MVINPAARTKAAPLIGVALYIGSDERVAGELLDALGGTAEPHGFVPVQGQSILAHRW